MTPPRPRCALALPAGRRPGGRRPSRRHRKRYAALLEGILSDAVRAGEIRPVDVALAARAVFGMCNWTYRWIGPDTPYRPREIVYAFWDIVANGIAPADNGRAVPAKAKPVSSRRA